MADELKLWGARIRYQAELSRRYHTARAAFLSAWHNAIQMAVAAYGASAFVVLFDGPAGSTPVLPEKFRWIYSLLGAVIAVVTLIDIIFKFSERAGDHRFLASQYSDVLEHVYTSQMTAEDFERLQERLARITASEPLPTFLYVEWTCHNDIMRVYNFDRKYEVPLSFIVRIIKNVTNAGSGRFKVAAHLEDDDNIKLYIDRMGIAIRTQN